MSASDTVSPPQVRPKKSETRDFLEFLIKLVIVVVAIRSPVKFLWHIMVFYF